MKKYKIWNRSESINGVSASHFLESAPFKGCTGDIILIYAEDGTTVSNVECKDILAQLFGIDRNLSVDNFMSAYFEKLAAEESVTV